MTGSVQPLENTVNTLITNTSPTTPPLTFNLPNLLSTAASGAPVTLKVLKTDGTVFGAADTCNTTTDSLQLNTAKGISIGGNQITGLGNPTQIASAGEINSIALGNNAATSASAFNSVAIGTGATVAANSSTAIAIGNNSRVANGGGVAIGAQAVASNTAGGAAFGVAIGQSSSAVGTSASGSSPVAIGIHANATGVGSQIAIGDQTISSGNNAISIGGHPFSAGTKATGDFSIAIGASSFATGLNSLAFGGDAAGGANASATNTLAIGAQTVASQAAATALGFSAAATGANATAIGTNSRAAGAGAVAVGSDPAAGASASASDSIAFGGQSSVAAVAVGAVAIGRGAISNLTGDVALGSGSTAAAPHAGAFTLNGGAVAGTAPASVVSVGAVGAERQVQNVAAGVVAATSTDAVNGSQLFAVGTAANNLGAGLASSLGGGASVAADGTVTNPAYAVGGATYTNVGSALGALQTGAPVQYATAAAPTTPNGLVPSQNVTLVGAAAGPVTLDNVAPGSSAAGSTQAVNGGQLNTGLASVATSLGGGSTYDPATGAVTAPSYVIGGVPHTNVGSALQAENTIVGAQGESAAAALGGAATYNPTTGAISGQSFTVGGTAYGTVTNAFAAVNASISGAGIKYFHTNSALPDSNAAQTDSIAVGPNALADAQNAIAVGAGATAAASAGDVALGAGSTTANTVSTAGTTLNGTAYTFAGVAPASTVSVGAVGAERTVTNLGAGRIAASSTDAINGSQLFATNTALDAIGTTAGNSVQYDSPAHTSVTLGGTGAPATVRLTNVSPGALTSTSTDAVNGSQLNTTDGNVTALGATTAANLGGGSTYTAGGGVSAPNYTVQGETYNNVGSALGAVDTSLTGLQNGTSGLVQQVGGAPGDGQITVGAATGGTSVNVAGTAGNRVLTGVAPGALTAGSVDAVNGGQLNTLGTALAANLGGGSAFDPVTGTATAPAYTIGGTTYNNVGAALGAQNTIVGAQGASVAAALGGTAIYDPATGAVSGQGFTVGGTTYGNVTNAFDAVNASIGGGAGIKYFHANSALPDSTATGTDSVAIGPNAVAANAGDVALGVGSVSAAPNAGAFTLNGGAVAGTAPASVVSVGVAGAERQVQNVAAGVVAATSTDAVNGSQLFAVGTAANNLGAGLASSLGGGASVAADGTLTNPAYKVGGATYDNVGGALGALQTGAPVQYATAAAPTTPNGLVPSQNVTLVGAAAGPVTLDNVAPGSSAAGSTQAVNGGQLNTGLASVATSLGGGSTYNRATGTVTAPSYAVQGAAYTNVGAALGAVDTTLTSQGAAIAGQGASITNLGNTVAGNSAAINALNNGTAGLVQQTGGAPGAGQITVGAATGGTSITVANNTGATRTVTGVSPGAVPAASTDAVNGSQLFDALLAGANPELLGRSTAAALGGGSVYNPATASVTAPAYAVGGQTYGNVGGAIAATNTLAVQYKPDAAGNPTNTVDLTKGGTIAPTTVSGVAPGAVTATSTDAVNGSQLFSTNRHVAGDTAALGGGAAFDPATGNYTPPSYVVQGTTQNTVGGAITALNAAVGQAAANAVQYDSPAHTSVTLNAGGAAAVLHNVAPGVLPNDAVNLGQLQASSAATLTQANAYTDGRINALDFDLRRQINTTGAKGAALAGVPQSVIPGEGFIGGAIGGQADQVAFALGVSKVFDSKHEPILKAGVSVDTRGTNATYNVGAGFHF